MQAFSIPDIRDFMTKLLSADTFDTFLVTEAVLTTFTTFEISGTYHPDYFDTDSGQGPDAAGSEQYISWRMLRPCFHDLIRGKQKPLGFRIVMRLADYNVEKLLRQTGVPFRVPDIAGLYLNISYDGKNITCITGTALKIFTPDRSLEHTWDEMVGKLLQQKQIPYVVSTR